jgi:hypothetical protein
MYLEVRLAEGLTVHTGVVTQRQNLLAGLALEAVLVEDSGVHTYLLSGVDSLLALDATLGTSTTKLRHA